MGRPREPLIDRDRIVDAALALHDREGAAGLRTRRLATELGVSAPSLYQYVDGIGAILDAIRDRLNRRITVPDWDDLAWPEAVAAGRSLVLRRLRTPPRGGPTAGTAG